MLTVWKAGSILRDKQTGQPYLVLHVYTNICTLVSDYRSAVPLVILERDYDKYAKDSDMQQQIKKNDELDTIEEWAYSPMMQKATI